TQYLWIGLLVPLDEFKPPARPFKDVPSVKGTPLRHGQDLAPAVEHDRGFFFWSARCPGRQTGESTVLASRPQSAHRGAIASSSFTISHPGRQLHHRASAIVLQHRFSCFDRPQNPTLVAFARFQP